MNNIFIGFLILFMLYVIYHDLRLNNKIIAREQISKIKLFLLILIILGFINMIRKNIFNSKLIILADILFIIAVILEFLVAGLTEEGLIYNSIGNFLKSEVKFADLKEVDILKEEDRFAILADSTKGVIKMYFKNDYLKIIQKKIEIKK